MIQNSGLLRVMLFLACIYLLEMAKRAGYINIGIQVAGILIIMALFLFWQRIIKMLKK